MNSKNEKHFSWGLNIQVCRMNSKNEKHFSWGVNIQVCELLQVLKGAFKNKCSWNSKTQ